MTPPFSLLDLAPVAEGSTVGHTFRSSVELAREAERLGYRRIWLAEHHGMIGVASAATAVVIGHVAGATEHIRVGAGGVMLPNHAPYIIAEQFGTLDALYPGRIDLGLGRAPGTDPATARAIRRDLASGADRFPQDVLELQHWFREPEPGQRVVAVPAAGRSVPLWLLGSSTFSAQLAARLGLPFAFASHFAPDQMERAITAYRSGFQPSPDWPEPHLMLTVNVVAADDADVARRLFTSVQQQFVRLLRRTPGRVPPPVDRIDWTPAEQRQVEHTLRCSFVGDSASIEVELAAFLERHRPDELMVSGHFHDPGDRLRSVRITAEIRDRLAAGGRGPA
ncbi:LLM class flavin-dependent oxidoreductase [Gaopeijia maritima]|uniref:LLM class flavin-dependent oxidoreductase n=1 Tax=Gaopeijia maritima TaxID=3119007 RepID=UPI00325278B9